MHRQIETSNPAAESLPQGVKTQFSIRTRFAAKETDVAHSVSECVIFSVGFVRGRPVPLSVRLFCTA